MMQLVLMMIGAAAFLMAVFLDYLRRLPEAPTCPECGSLTCETDRGPLADQILANMPAMGLRTCRSCGWVGLMRWRLAQQEAPRRVAGSHGRAPVSQTR